MKTLTSLKWPYVPEESAFPDPLKRDDPKPLQLPQYEAIGSFAISGKLSPLLKYAFQRRHRSFAVSLPPTLVFGRSYALSMRYAGKSEKRRCMKPWVSASRGGNSCWRAKMKRTGRHCESWRKLWRAPCAVASRMLWVLTGVTEGNQKQ